MKPAYLFGFLTILVFLSSCTIAVSPVVWIWTGWGNGWRTAVSGLVCLVGFSTIGFMYGEIIKPNK